jgi:hypothetical protein
MPAHGIANTVQKLSAFTTPEAEFLDAAGTKFLRVFLLTIHRNLKPENSQDYAQ